jgi:hypothetical protein
MRQRATTSREMIDVKGSQLVEKVKELFHEGNIRLIIVKASQGDTIMELPLTVGVVGFLPAPRLAAIGAFAAIAADCSLEVERERTETSEPIVTAISYASAQRRS